MEKNVYIYSIITNIEGQRRDKNNFILLILVDLVVGSYIHRKRKENMIIVFL